MFDTLMTGTALAVVGIPTAAIGVRQVMASKLVNKARTDAVGGIQAFKDANNYVGDLPDEFRADVSVLHYVLQSSRDMRAGVIEKMQSMKMPDGMAEEHLPELQVELKKDARQFFSALGDVAEHRMLHLFKEQVGHRLKKAKFEMAQKMAEHGKTAAGAAAATAGVGAAAAANADDIGDAAAAMGDAASDVFEQAEPHLNALEQQIVDYLDKLGVIDFTVDAVQGAEKEISEFIANHFGESASDHASQLGHLATGAMMFPGMISTAYSVIREFDMLMNDETSFGDAFVNGAVPQMLKTAAMSVGIFLDGLTGGASFGFFTFAMRFLAGKGVDKALEGQNHRLTAEYNALAQEVSNFYKQTKRIINGAVADFKTAFLEQIEKCPDIENEKMVQDFMNNLREAYNKGLADSTEKLADNTQKAIKGLPARNWVDKVLFINRPQEVEKLYLAAQRDINSHMSGIVHEFSLAAETHAAAGVDFVLNHPIFPNIETRAVFKKAAETALDSAEAYNESLGAWEQQTVAFWKEGTEKVAEISEREGKAYKAFARAKEAIMSPILRKIKANQRRMGIKQKGPKAAYA